MSFAILDQLRYVLGLPLDAVKVITTMFPNIETTIIPLMTRGAILEPKAVPKNTEAMSISQLEPIVMPSFGRQSPVVRPGLYEMTHNWLLISTLLYVLGYSAHICDINKHKEYAGDTHCS